jgi:hypothetical protein
VLPVIPFHTIVVAFEGAIVRLPVVLPPLPVYVTVTGRYEFVLLRKTQKDPPSQFCEVGNVIVAKDVFVML